jgi:hypothetical protein
MKDQIEKATAVLIGKTVWQCTRAADMACFDFGERRTVPSFRGGTKEVGEYALHVECAWRVRHGEEIVVARRDLYYPADYQHESGDNPPSFDWDKDPNRLEKLFRLFFENGARSFMVLGARAAEAGGLNLALCDGFYLELFPDYSFGDEYWRLFRPSAEEPHFVVTGRGIET